MNRRLRRLLKQMAANDKSYYFEEGTKVKINSNTFNAGNPKRNSWYEEHKNEEFTIQYDPHYGQKPIIYELVEDTSEPKWLFSFHELSKVKLSTIKGGGCMDLKSEPRFLLSEDSLCYGCSYYCHWTKTRDPVFFEEFDMDEYGGVCDSEVPCINGVNNQFDKEEGSAIE